VFGLDLEPRVTQLAHHFGRARAGARAVDYARRAAEQAEQRLAFNDATAYWRSARTALEVGGAPDQSTLARLLLRTAAAMRRAGDQAGGSVVNDEALAAAERAGDVTLLAEAALAYGEIGLWQVRPYGTIDQRVVTAMSRALREIDPDDCALRARLLVGLAVALYYDEGERRRGEALAREAVAMARRLEDRRLLVEALVELVVMLDASPDLSRQLVMAEELAELQGPDIPVEISTTARMRLARLRLANGDSSRLRADIEHAADEADAHRQPLVQMWATWARTTVAFLNGQLTEAESLANAAFTLHQQVGIWGAAETYGLHMMLIWREQGRMVDMAPIVEPILRDAVHPGARKMLGVFAIERGAADEIADILGPDPIPRVHDFTWLAEVCVTAELASAAGLPCAGELYEILLPFRDRVITMDGTFFCMGSASRYLGMLAEMLGRRGDAIAHFEQAAETDDRISAIPWSVRSRWHLGQLLLPVDRRRARQLLTEAHRGAVTHDLIALRSLIGRALENS
jgi:tetratricopeptide (TPR) repeat protein